MEKPSEEMRRKLRFFEMEQILGPGAFQLAFLTFVGRLDLTRNPPIPLIRANNDSIAFAAIGLRLNPETQALETYKGVFMQDHWDYGGSYLGMTRSEKSAAKNSA